MARTRRATRVCVMTTRQVGGRTPSRPTRTAPRRSQPAGRRRSCAFRRWPTETEQEGVEPDRDQVGGNTQDREDYVDAAASISRCQAISPRALREAAENEHLLARSPSPGAPAPKAATRSLAGSEASLGWRRSRVTAEHHCVPDWSDVHGLMAPVLSFRAEPRQRRSRGIAILPVERPLGPDDRDSSLCSE